MRERETTSIVSRAEYPYSARMSQENTHKLMGLYMEVLILDVTATYTFFLLL